MRLWIDGQCLQTASRMRGIGRYVIELVRAIAEHHPDVELSMSFNAAMPDEALAARETVNDIVDPSRIFMWHGAARNGEAVEGYTNERRLSELAIAHHVNCLAPHVALSASPFEGPGDATVPLLADRGCTAPVASIFYDAIPHRFSDFYLKNPAGREYYYRRLDAHAGFDTNLCISAFAQSELRSIHPAARSSNIYAGISKEFLEFTERKDAVGLPVENFILYVGALDPRKNVKALVEAFPHLDRAWPGNDLKLVLAGDAPVELLGEVVALWNRLKLERNRLVCLGHVSDEDLVGLFRQARLLVQPSLMEGFGLTALEAIYCGTPVAAARAGALPEIVNRDEFLFDPRSPGDLADVIVRVVRDRSQTRELMYVMREHASQFTWERSAGLAVESLRGIADKSPRKDVASSRKGVLRLARLDHMPREIAARCLSLSEPGNASGRLLVDVTATTNIDHKTGIQRVVRKIGDAMTRSPPTTVTKELVFCNGGRVWHAVDGSTFTLKAGGQENRRIAGRDFLLMLDSSWDLFEVHQPLLRACRLSGGEVTTCLYDTVPIYAAAMCNPAIPPVFSHWLRSALAYSSGFVCISRAVADELIALLEAIEFPRRMKVGYWQLGADFATGGTAGAGKSHAPPTRPRFLMVGTLEPRKGHGVALDAFDLLWAGGLDAELLIVGKVGWGIAHMIERMRAHPEFGRRLIWQENVTDEELADHYAGCNALIAASFSEGFGLPIVEAGHYGRPVLASDIPVFREVAKGAAEAHFFAAGRPAALAESVKAFLRRDEAGERHLARGDWPDWVRSAAQLEDVVVGGNWYRRYEPLQKRPYAPLDDIGRTDMSGPLAESEREHRLDLVEGPYLSDDRHGFKIVVAVTNLSGLVWSSAGGNDGAFGVNLAYRLRDARGADTGFEAPRTPIPFVLPSGVTILLSVEVPVELVDKGATDMAIELVQEGVSWFGEPLLVKLRQSPAPRAGPRPRRASAAALPKAGP